MSTRVETLQPKVLHQRPPSRRPWRPLLIALTAGVVMAGASTYLALRGGSREAAPLPEVAGPAHTRPLAPAELGNRVGIESVTVRKVAWEPGRFEEYWGPNDPDLGFDRVGGYQSAIASTALPAKPAETIKAGPSGTRGDPWLGCPTRTRPGPC